MHFPEPMEVVRVIVMLTMLVVALRFVISLCLSALSFCETRDPTPTSPKTQRTPSRIVGPDGETLYIEESK